MITASAADEAHGRYYYHVSLPPESAPYEGMRYRYRSPVLLGAWQKSAELACADAIRAKQARLNEDATLTWYCGAVIEAVALGEIARQVPGSRRS